MSQAHEPGAYFFEIKSKHSFSFDWNELFVYKELFYFFTRRDIKVKYKETFFGVAWALIQPTIMMLTLTFFLGSSMKTTTPGIQYPLFLFSGLILWLVFSGGLINAGNSMVANAQIIKKIYFPRLIIPLSSILVSVFDFFLAFALFIALTLYYQQPVNILLAVWLWPLALLVTVLATFGLGAWLAALNIKYRDFRYALPFMVQLLLFVTPVIYPVTILKQTWMQYVSAINPMYGALALFRLPLTTDGFDATLVSISMVSLMLILIFGLFYFKRMEMYFADLA